MICGHYGRDDDHFEDMMDGKVLMSSNFQRRRGPKSQNAQQTMWEKANNDWQRRWLAVSRKV